MKFISSTNDIRKYLGLKPKKDIKFKNISIDTRTHFTVYWEQS